MQYTDPSTKQQPVTVYQIRLRGHLGQRWAEWFDGWSITLEDEGDTLLTRSVADQATLHGALKRVRDLGMPLVSVLRVTAAQSTEAAADPAATPQADTGTHT